jgi:hypothetical protein
MRWTFAVLVLAGCGGTKPGVTVRAAEPELRRAGSNELLAVSEFEGIADRPARSRALFAEAARVLLHPRCVNCHPSGDSPHQRIAAEPHDPPVVRGPGNNGVPGMECTTCHQDRNQPLTRVPGAPNWHLAPIEMAWQGKSAASVCSQIKDTARNGGRSLAKVIDHSANDPLVGWGWQPGADREPAPGTQAAFAALVTAWVETGAECPQEAP